MRYVFFGTPRFAEIVLRGLIEGGLPPIALVANPDRPVGRKKMITPPPTKRLLAEKAPGVPILQPERLEKEFLRELEALAPDLAIVAAYGNILRKPVLEVPKFGTVGVHPSLLPKYRGASPIQTAILEGSNTTGVSLYHMDEKTDHGPVIAHAALSFDPLTTSYAALERMLAERSAALLLETLPQIERGETVAHPQSEADMTMTRKFSLEDGFIDPADLASAEKGDHEKAKAIMLTINALGAEPGAWTMRAGKRLKILRAVIDGNRFILKEVQEEGGRPRSL